MGKRWIMLLVIAMFGILVTAAYAGQYMVVVIEVEKGDVMAVYDAKTMGKVQKSGVTFDAKPVDKMPIGKTLSVKGRNVVDIPDYTVLRTHSSPGCVTYTYGNYSWEVCT